jgi:SpoIID/LytB domain protein
MGAPRPGRRDRAFSSPLFAPAFAMRAIYHRPWGRKPRGRLATLAVAALSSLALLAAPAGASTLIIEGAGDGHGVGMSQYGALGYAKHGWSYQQILAHYYTGTALGTTPATTTIKVLVGSKVVKLPIERYVRGVVSAEMPSSWPMAALEAQAIASRTYALTSDAGGSRFNVYSDTRSQMYLGVAAETAATNAAVAATAGQVVTYAGKPAATYFFSSSGGMTENIEDSFIGSTPEPWLRGVTDQYEEPSVSSWKVSMSFGAAGKLLSGLFKGSFRGIEVLTRGVSPRIVSVNVLGSGGSSTVTGPELASLLGLQSSWAYFSVKNGKKVTREPDRSSHSTAKTTPVHTPKPAPTPATPTGGPVVSAPSAGASKVGVTGGSSAG